MSPLGTKPVFTGAAEIDPAKIAGGAKTREAAQQFEALLLGQILKSARESSGGWLGSAGSSSDCATEFAEQHVAAMLAQQGGLGLATLITQGLERDR